MADSGIDRKKVNEIFDNHAKRHGNENAVLDAGDQDGVKHKNIYRDYVSKRLLLKYLQPHPNDTVVDYGCGVGRLTRFLAPRVKRIEALDRSAEMIRVASENFPVPGNAHYTALSDERMPLPENSADALFTFWVLQHVSEDELQTILLEAKRVVKHNGRIVFFEQTRDKPGVYGAMQNVRTPDQYTRAGATAGLKLVRNERAFRFPSYGMNVWQRFQWLPKAAPPALFRLETMTTNRKPETIDYATTAIVFENNK